jgi:hypothetical protein
MNVLQGRFGYPCINAGMIFRHIAGVPVQMRHSRGKKHCMLSGTGTDLQNMSTGFKIFG